MSVGLGALEEDRVRRVGQWFEWSEGKLYLKGEVARIVPPIVRRGPLV